MFDLKENCISTSKIITGMEKKVSNRKGEGGIYCLLEKLRGGGGERQRARIYHQTFPG